MPLLCPENWNEKKTFGFRMLLWWSCHLTHRSSIDINTRITCIICSMCHNMISHHSHCHSPSKKSHQKYIGTTRPMERNLIRCQPNYFSSNTYYGHIVTLLLQLNKRFHQRSIGWFSALFVIFSSILASAIRYDQIWNNWLNIHYNSVQSILHKIVVLLVYNGN